MKRLVYLLLFLSVGLNAQVLRTYPPYLPTTVTTGGATTLTNGLFIYYNMDDASTTITDALGSNNATATGTAQSATSILGYSQLFTANDHITLSNSLKPSGVTFTFSVWIRLTTLPSNSTYQVIYQLSANRDPWTSIHIGVSDADNTIRFAVCNDEVSPTTYTVKSSGAVSIDTWYHVVAICRGAGQTLQLYVNGSDVSTAAGTFTGIGTLTVATDNNIGNDYDPWSSTFIGYIDEYSGYNRLVSVDSLYNAGSGVTHPFN